MPRKKVSTTVYITPEQHERLKILHERTKVPTAVIVREGIDLALAKYEHLLPGQTLLLPNEPLVTPLIREFAGDERRDFTTTSRVASADPEVQS